jgi:hypothetical protein
MNFYVYIWLRDDGTPYYVGKGRADRAFTNKHHIPHRPDDPERILVQEYITEAEAFEAEIFFIDYYGRINSGTGCLRNQTEGGVGSSGYKHTDETKKIMSRIHKGKTITEKFKIEHRARMSGSGNPMWGKKRPHWISSKAGRARSRATNHIRWHIGRGKIVVDCSLCTGAS